MAVCSPKEQLVIRDLPKIFMQLAYFESEETLFVTFYGFEGSFFVPPYICNFYLASEGHCLIYFIILFYFLCRTSKDFSYLLFCISCFQDSIMLLLPRTGDAPLSFFKTFRLLCGTTPMVCLFCQIGLLFH